MLPMNMNNTPMAGNITGLGLLNHPKPTAKIAA
jgi:hypothetical protein